MSGDKDYAHMRDPEAQRTRYELWAIIVIVVVVVAGGLIWRSLAHKPAGPQRDWNGPAGQYPNGTTAAAGAGVHPASPPPPRPVAP